MIRTFIILLITISGISCSSGQEPVKKSIVISVIDKNKNIPIENAEATLTTIVEARDIYREIQLTNASGKCTFAFELKPSSDYGIAASKKGYLAYLEDDPVKISKSDAIVTSGSPGEITLYLTSDPMHQVEFFSKTEKRYEIAGLIQLMKSGQFHGGIPLLYWEDIPQLLAAGNDSTLILSYPVNPLSSSIREAPLGMIALWFIESIRLAEGNKMILPYEKYPSLNPVIRTRDNPEAQNNDAEKQGQVYKAYIQWWSNVKNMDAVSGSKINPLDGTDFLWN